MLLVYRLAHRLFIPVLMVLIAISMPRCSKNNGPHDKSDSTDTLPKKIVYDSAAYHVSFVIDVFNTSGVFNDTFSDDASMLIYIVNGVIKIPRDSILNFPPMVTPSTGSNGVYRANWIADNIGEINITGATGLALVDTLAAISLTQTGCVSPKWKLTALQGGTVSYGGGEPNVGWPLAFSFNPKLENQDAFQLAQSGSYWDIFVYKEH